MRTAKQQYREAYRVARQVQKIIRQYPPSVYLVNLVDATYRGGLEMNLYTRDVYIRARDSVLMFKHN